MKGLITSADDYGMSLSINSAIEDLMQSGSLSSTGIMTNMPHVESITDLLHRIPNIGVGVHTTLTQGLPISPIHDVHTLLDKKGSFYPPDIFISRLLSGRISLKQCRIELKRQIEKAATLTNNNISHCDSHHGIHRYEPLLTVFLNVCRQMGIRSIRTHKHYWMLSSSGNNLFGSMRPEGSMKSKFNELYYSWMRWRIRKHFIVPKGIIVLNSYDQIIDVASRLNHVEGVFEAVFHPATSTDDLVKTSLLEDRIKEYQFLSSPDTVSLFQNLKKQQLHLTFKGLYS